MVSCRFLAGSGIENKMKPLRRFFEALVQAKTVGDENRDVEEQLPVVERIGTAFEIDILFRIRESHFACWIVSLRKYESVVVVIELLRGTLEESGYSVLIKSLHKLAHVGVEKRNEL